MDEGVGWKWQLFRVSRWKRKVIDVSEMRKDRRKLVLGHVNAQLQRPKSLLPWCSPRGGILQMLKVGRMSYSRPARSIISVKFSSHREASTTRCAGCEALRSSRPFSASGRRSLLGFWNWRRNQTWLMVLDSHRLFNNCTGSDTSICRRPSESHSPRLGASSLRGEQQLTEADSQLL